MKKEILTLFMSGSSVILAAQTTGTVVDENKQPLPAATVSLFRESENKMISGVVTDMNGGFELNTREGESYKIRISFVGYSTQEIKCQNISKHLSVGTIVLEPESKQLNDVTVTANNVIQKVDRQIIIPNLLQQKTSSNGLSLLQHLQLSRISVNTLDSKVTTTMGDAVELRINGVKAEIQEVKALLPADVLKIEYHDNPGLRYGNVAAVIDIILKEKKNGGSISGELMNTINPLGIGDYQLSGNYHVGKSNFKTSINWNRRDINWLRENMEAFNATTPSINNYEIGQKTKAQYDNINLSIGYDYINSGNILSVTFRDLYNNTPHAVFDRNSKLIQNSNTFDIMDRTKSRSNNPSLDIYYQHEFTKDKHLFFDLIGTYINTKNDRLYRQSQGNSVQEISSHVDGNKYSAIAEVIYEQKIKDSQLSFGLRHQQMYTKNAYDGNTSSSVKMNTGESYGFGEWASKLGKLDYMVGVGAMRTYVSQGNAKQVKYIFRPTIQLGYHFNNYLSIRYKAYMGGYAPSLAELSDVEQHIDIYQIRRGNPNLQAVRFFSNELSISVGTKYISAEWFTRYSYDDKPYMEETTYSNGFYVRSYANQRGFHRLNSQINLKVQPWKDYISIQLTPFVNRYISNGNTYTHTHTNWGLRANLMGMYKNWYVGANLETSFHRLWGETLNKDEKSHSIVFGYNREKWGVELQLQNIFSSRYEMSVENLSHLAPYNQMVWSKNLCKVFGIDFHFNLNFGKHGSEVNQRIHNSDTDAGIVPTTK